MKKLTIITSNSISIKFMKKFKEFYENKEPDS